ncbi:MAG: bifunctional 4-hydroxy-3-methylbut-2-enyl diphosphate reductase/30S ribosomal protein S1 [Firmicutes bacterium]|nr:bifunctional 4-hydroxy-3-methylbut-2-enyl diphosphate reductase/30S ribosomal protein S1 [Bacillota bacterium]
MEIILAKSAGFCFGVKNAVKTAYEKAETETELYTYGPIIHNKTVTDDLEKKGVHVIEDLDSAPAGGKIIIRSHGVPPKVYEDIEKRGFEYFDCTCPFVKKIHRIVEDRHKKGMEIIITGSPVHPEVVGINGWCGNSAVIISSVEEAKAFELEKGKKYALVSQTTFQTDTYDEIADIICEKTDAELNRTICLATAERQHEAVEIAKQVDCMIILGDKKSSNTRKLYEISKKYCENTFLCETFVDLDLKFVLKYGKIGITAGASTPPAIIKEAVNTMSENENKSFEEMLDESMVTLRTGDIVKGTVIQVSETGDVSVNLGFKSDGIISRSDFSDDPNTNPADVVKAGDVIDVYVVRVNDGEGFVQLSKKKIDAVKGYDEIEEAFNNSTTVKGKVIEQVKGGLIALINGIRVFVPSSQISNRYVEDLKAFIGQEFDFNILEYDNVRRRKIVAGRKALAQKEIDEKRKEVFGKINVGDRIEGTVSRIVEFGAFVDLGGVDGLIHISEMSWGRIKKVTDVLKEGDKVTVTVLDVNAEKGKISLSLKDLNADPWKSADEKYAVGNVVSGKVVRMVPFGAFVELEEGIDGLVHISQIAYEHVEKPEDVLTVGQEISAKVTELDLDNKKISLSIKETLPKPEKAAEEAPAEE